MSFLKGLVGSGLLFSFQATQAPASTSIAITTHKAGEIVGNDAFYHFLLGIIMTGNEHEMLT